MHQWNDMSTAPADGSQILVQVMAGYYAVVSFWSGAWRETANGLALRNPPLLWMAISDAEKDKAEVAICHD